MSVGDLPARHEEAWLRATRHPFLAQVREGTLPEDAFAVWLVQDYLFVSDLLRFQARLLAVAPREAQAVLAGGAVALVDELAWFEGHAERLRLDLGAERLPATRAYAELLARLETAESGTALTALWALERVYLDSWSFAAPAAEPYDEFVAHWTTPEFHAYVGALEAAADAAGGREDEFLAVVEAEEAFWDTALP
jgi:thiaminase/transcriptional activator TenA